MSRSILTGSGLVALLAVASSAHAAVITTSNFSTASSSPYAASATSLIQVGNQAFNSATASTALANGVAPLHDANVGTFSYSDAASSYSVTYNLNLSTNLAGYDISSIRTVSGWTNNTFFGRIQQGYSVTLISVDDVEVTLAPSYSTAIVTAGGWLELAISDDASALLASGIKSVRFDINRLSNVGTIYYEIEVEGAATPIPEPTALSLLGVALVGLTRRRRC